MTVTSHEAEQLRVPQTHMQTQMITLEQIERQVAKFLSLNRIAFASEARLQTAITDALTGLGLEVEREKRISAADRLDMWLPATGTVIETKLKLGGFEALRQIARYLKHPEVTGALLIANRIPNRVPDLEGKQIRYMELWRFHI